MTRDEFIERLMGHMSGLPEAEIIKAREYYVEYFNEARDQGKTDEQTSAELDPPEVIAARIRLDLGGGPGRSADGFWESLKEHRVIWIIVAILALPVILPVLAGVVSAAFGLVGGVVGILIAVFACLGGFVVAGFGLVIASVALFVAGIASLAALDPFRGFALIGIGFILLGIAILIIIGAIKLITLVCEGIKRLADWITLKLRKGGSKREKEV